MRSTNNLDACALCESIRASVGHRRERRKQQTKAEHQLLSLIARRRALVTLNSDHFLL